jgi:Queuine tRNA-ribosyltransferase
MTSENLHLPQMFGPWLFPTKIGQPNYLLREVFRTLPFPESNVFILRFPHFLNHGDMIARSGKGLGPYLGYSPSKTFMITMHDNGSDSKCSIEDKSATVNLETPAGNQKVSIDDYYATCFKMQAHFIESFHDSVQCDNAGKNRTRALIERTFLWLDHSISVFRSYHATKSLDFSSLPKWAPPITKSKRTYQDLEQLIENSRETAAPDIVLDEKNLQPKFDQSLHYPKLVVRIPILSDEAVSLRFSRGILHRLKNNQDLIGGVIIGGFSDTNSIIASSQFNRIEQLVKEIRVFLPTMPIILPCLGVPSEIISGLQIGVTHFDSSYPEFLTKNNHATLLSSYSKRVTENKLSERKSEAVDVPPSKGVSRASTLFPLSDQDKTLLDSDKTSKLNLVDIEQALNTNPIKPTGCECFTCGGVPSSIYETEFADFPSGRSAGNVPLNQLNASNRFVEHKGHSVAYIHHLLNCNEILAQVLLSAHNNYAYLRFMQEAEEAKRSGSLQHFSEWISN